MYVKEIKIININYTSNLISLIMVFLKFIELKNFSSGLIFHLS